MTKIGKKWGGQCQRVIGVAEVARHDKRRKSQGTQKQARMEGSGLSRTRQGEKKRDCRYLIRTKKERKNK